MAVLAFPNFGYWLLGFVLLIPLLSAIEGQGGRHAFRLGFLMGLIYFGGSLSWIDFTMVRYGGMPRALALPVLFLLAAYLALYPAFFAMLLERTRQSTWPLALRTGVMWCGLEGLRGYLLTGFPWNLLGQSLHATLPFLQLADLGGAYGLSFYLAIINGALY